MNGIIYTALKVIECLLVAISGLFGTVRRRSALPPIADINGYGAGGPLLTHSGHSPTDPEARLHHQKQ